MIPGPPSLSIKKKKAAKHAPSTQFPSKDTVTTLAPVRHSFPRDGLARVKPCRNRAGAGGWKGAEPPENLGNKGPGLQNYLEDAPSSKDHLTAEAPRKVCMGTTHTTH